MLRDRYENAVSTASPEARDHYVVGVDRFLGANAGAAEAFAAAIAADDDFALAYAGLARARHAMADGVGARAAFKEAQSRADSLTAREQRHLACLEKVISGDGGGARRMIREHLDVFPRDAFILQPMTGVFGLIGFSGAPGREETQLSFIEGFADQYSDDWWFTGQHAFALCETGRISAAVSKIDRALNGNPRNANAAHIKAHIHYEQGDPAGGLAYLADWTAEYPKQGPLHCHVSWHLAIWFLEQGNRDAAWSWVETAVCPDAAHGPPINVATDTAAFLFRAELAGEAPRPDLWRQVSEYVATSFPKPGVAFADVHAALAHAMAGRAEPLERIVRDATGPAGDVVREVAEGFSAFARGDYKSAAQALVGAMPRNAQVGGSRAQRDLIAYAAAAALMRSRLRRVPVRLIA
ncbi:MAG: tetratricopeptide repeat protein [Pseudomonadota bacterium]